MKKHQSDREMSVDNFEDTPHILKESDPDLPKVQRNHAGSIRERLERLGVPLKYQSSIRVAPIKGSGLPPCFLESKVTEIVSWLRNLKQLKADLPLPEITSVTPSWETPRDGARFKIVRICLRDENGLDTMKDLMQGSKLNLVNGFPRELELHRDKIYVSLSHPHVARPKQIC